MTRWTEVQRLSLLQEQPELREGEEEGEWAVLFRN